MADRVAGSNKERTTANRAGIGTASAMVLAFLILGASAISCAHAEMLVQNRITAPIRSGQMQAIRGTVHPLVAEANDQGELSASTAIQGMSLVFRRSTAQEADLRELLQQQQTKGSPMYHRWLQPGQFAARYGMSASDLSKAAAWLQSQGFKIDAIPASNDRIDFSGTAAQVDAAFQTELHQYSLHGQMHRANATDISLPHEIAGMVLGVEHLNTFRPLPHNIQTRVYAAQRGAGATPQYTVHDQSGAEVNLVAPSDIATIYNVGGLYNSGFTGKGQTIAIVGQTDITTHQNDIATFRTLSGLDAANLPTQIVVPNIGCPAGSTPAISADDLQEADIDVEWSGAVAKDATIVYVTVCNTQNNVFDSLFYAIQTPLANNNTQVAPVISISYGGCELEDISQASIQQIESILEQANAQGQTIVASSGDDGSAGCDDVNSSATVASHGLSVSYPSSSEFVTAAGGTSFSADQSDQGTYWNASNNSDNGSARSYIPETTWNDTGGQLSASGGGASAVFSKPSWQVGPGVPGDGKRDVPDVSLAADPAHDGYVLCTQETSGTGTNVRLTGVSSCAPAGPNNHAFFDTSGNAYLYGGTSIAAPQLAAMIALWNQEAGNTAGVGNANPIFYSTAQTAPGAFHDVTTGSNAVACQPGSTDCSAGTNVMSCCSAGIGYDQATGLGSVDVTAMGAAWPHLSVATQNPQQPTFSLLLNPSALSVSPGGSITTSVVLNPSGAGGNSAPGFSGMVSLACSNLPAGVTCSFAPGSSVNLGPGVAQTVTLTVSAATSVAHQSTSDPLRRGWPMQTAFAGVLGLALFGFGKKRRYFPSRWMILLLLAGGLVAASTLTACGSGSSPGSTVPTKNGPSPTAQTLTVTGTSGTTTASAQIQLTVL